MRLASKSKIINILDAEHQAKWDHVHSRVFRPWTEQLLHLPKPHNDPTQAIEGKYDQYIYTWDTTISESGLLLFMERIWDADMTKILS